MAEKEYIERESLLKDISETVLFWGGVKLSIPEMRGSNKVIDRIKSAPAADVVEVVRCKDCKLSSEPKAVSRLDLYSNNYDVRFCQKEQKLVCGTHFCSYGEAKMDGRGEE